MFYVDHRESLIDKMCTCVPTPAASHLEGSSALSDHGGVKPEQSKLLGDFPLIWPGIETSDLQKNGTLTSGEVDLHAKVTHRKVTDTKGITFFNHHDFEFIGPDRQPSRLTKVEDCLKLAKIIKGTGVPNYKSARFPLQSYLKLDRWADI